VAGGATQVLGHAGHGVHVALAEFGQDYDRPQAMLMRRRGARAGLGERCDHVDWRLADRQVAVASPVVAMDRCSTVGSARSASAQPQAKDPPFSPRGRVPTTGWSGAIS
jgi:hypothetical protein